MGREYVASGARPAPSRTRVSRCGRPSVDHRHQCAGCRPSRAHSLEGGNSKHSRLPPNRPGGRRPRNPIDGVVDPTWQRWPRELVGFRSASSRRTSGRSPHRGFACSLGRRVVPCTYLSV
eukprot:24470-Prymnesium_polylepis.1